MNLLALSITSRRATAVALISLACLSGSQLAAQEPGGIYMTTSVTSMVSVSVYDADVVDEPPCFPGGDRELLNFINRTRKYPSAALESRSQGRVLCGFVVMPDGRVTNASVVRGVECSLDAEALRIVGKMPRWEPGRMDGRAVPVYYVLPIVFRLM